VAQHKNCPFAVNTTTELKIYITNTFDNNSTIVIQRRIFELTSLLVLAGAVVIFFNTFQMGNYFFGSATNAFTERHDFTI